MLSLGPVETLRSGNSAQDRHTAPPGAFFWAKARRTPQSPLYQKHDDHFHPVRPQIVRASTSEISLDSVRTRYRPRIFRANTSEYSLGSLRTYFRPKKTSHKEQEQNNAKRPVSFAHEMPRSIVTQQQKRTLCGAESLDYDEDSTSPRVVPRSHRGSASRRCW